MADAATSKNARKKQLRNGGGAYVEAQVAPDVQQAKAKPDATPGKLSGSCPHAKTAEKAAEKPKVFRISGVVRDAAGQPLDGVGVTLDPAVKPAQTSGPNGAFTFSDVPAGTTCTVTAADGGKVFDPASIAIANLQGDRPNADFRQKSFRVAGRLLPEGAKDAPAYFFEILKDCEVVLTGAAQPNCKLENGAYHFDALPSGAAYKVQCKLADRTLGPAREIAALTGDTVLDLAVPAYRLSGNITGLLLPDEAAGTKIAVTSPPKPEIVLNVENDGRFDVPCLPAGFDYFVRARREKFTFTPGRADCRALAANVNHQFAVKTFQVTGNVTASGTLLDGIDIEVTGVRTIKRGELKTVKGAYSVDLPETADAYTVSAVAPGYEFKALSGVTSKAPKADFRAALENVTVRVQGADVPAKRALERLTGQPGTDQKQINDLDIELTGGPRARTTKIKIGEDSAVFRDLVKGLAYTAGVRKCPGYFAVAPQPAVDGKATLTVALQSFVLSGKVTKIDRRTNAVTDYGGVSVLLKQGSEVLQTVQSQADGTYGFAAVPGGDDYVVTIEPTAIKDGDPYWTFCPHTNANAQYRSFTLAQLAAGSADLNFEATCCQIRSGGSGLLGELWVAANRKAVLSAEVIKSMQGDRSKHSADEIARHQLRMDDLADAIQEAYNSGNAGPEFNLRGGTLKLIFYPKWPAQGDGFIGNVVTVYYL